MTAPTLLFTCPVCLVATDDTACDCCGRALTAKDLTITSQEPSSSRKEASLGSQPEGL